MRLRELTIGAALVLGLALLQAPAAQPLALPPPPSAGLTPQPGAALPMALVLTDAEGAPVRLGDLFTAGRPVLLVPGYYSCPQLCGLLMQSLLQALHDAGTPPGSVRIVRFSIDPQDTPADARRRRSVDLAYARWLAGAAAPEPPIDLRVLTGTAAATAALARELGFRYERSPDASPTGERLYAHAAAVVIATPQGRVSSYLTGMRFDPAELRLALAAAAQGRETSFSDRVALLCAHFDPRLGRHSEAVMNATRSVGVLLVAGLAGWCWRRRAPGPRETR